MKQSIRASGLSAVAIFSFGLTLAPALWADQSVNTAEAYQPTVLITGSNRGIGL